MISARRRERQARLSLSAERPVSSADPSVCPLSTPPPPPPLLFPRHFASLVSALSVHLLPPYLLPFRSSTCPCRVHPSDPATWAAGRQIASTPTGRNIAPLSAFAIDQIALAVCQQTRRDMRVAFTRARPHKCINDAQNAADKCVVVTAYLPSYFDLCHHPVGDVAYLCLSSVMSLS